MGCRCLSVCPCETTVCAPGRAPRELVLTARQWTRCRPRGDVSALGALWPGACCWVCWLPRDPLGSPGPPTSPAQLLLSEPGSVAARCPTAAHGLGLQKGHCGDTRFPCVTVGCTRPGPTKQSQGVRGNNFWATAAPSSSSSLDFHGSAWGGGASGAAHSPFAIALQLSQAGEEQSTCPFPNNEPASAQEARSDLFSLLCPLQPVIKGPSHCLNHFHDSVTSILRWGGWSAQPAQSRRHSSCGQRLRGLRGRVGGLGKGRRALAVPFPSVPPVLAAAGSLPPPAFLVPPPIVPASFCCGKQGARGGAGWEQRWLSARVQPGRERWSRS